MADGDGSDAKEREMAANCCFVLAQEESWMKTTAALPPPPGAPWRSARWPV